MEYRQLLVASAGSSIVARVHFVLFSAIAACGGGFILGTTLGWSAPSAGPIINDKIYKFFVTEFQFAWIVGLLALGGVFSSVFSGVIRSILGTRLSIVLFGIPILVGWVMIIMPLNPAMLMIGRFLKGIAIGCYVVIVPMYVGEISSNNIRGSLLSVFQVSMNSGLLFAFILGHFSTLAVLNIVCGSITVLYSLGFIFLPESPALLVSQDRGRAAEHSLKRLNRKSFDVKAEVSSLELQHALWLASQKTFSEVFSTKSTKKAFTIMMLQFFFFFQMSGINVVLFYSTTIFDDAGVDIDPGISSIIIASVQLVCSLLTYVVADRFGRKTLLIISNAFTSLSLVGIGTFFMIENTDNLQWLPLTSLTIFIIAFSIGMGPVSYILLGELFLQEAKMFVAPITLTLNLFLTFVIGLTFPMLTPAIGMGPTFFMFSGFCFLALLFTIFIIPETKGKSIAEIQELLE